METEWSVVLIAILCIFGHVLTIWLQMGLQIRVSSSVDQVDEGIHERIDALDENLGQIIGVIFQKIESFGSPQEVNPLASILQHLFNQNSPSDDYNRAPDGTFNGTTLEIPTNTNEKNLEGDQS